jgi:DNA-binding NtrC family response regulator
VTDPPVRTDPSTILLGNSRVMHRVRDQIATLAVLPWHVRIEGPSGTGKSVAARLLHSLSQRAHATFVLCSLASLPDGTALGELVGYRRGTFTGAYEHRAGKLEAAHGGTLFLDEIGTAGPEAQRALLQFVDTGIVQRLGEVRERPVDARLVFATNENLEALVLQRRFRADLYHRLGKLTLRMPALSEHADDVPLLMEYLLVAKAEEAGRPTPSLSSQDFDRLVAYTWPGNVRELGAVAEQIVAFGRLPDLFARLTTDQQWRTRIGDALTRCQGNKAAAARMLGVSRQQLHRALEAREA